MRNYAFAMLAVGALAVVSCGGDSPTAVPSPAPPTTTLPTQPPPTTLPPTPPPQQQCTLPPGPVTRLAISPRELRTDGVQADVYVRARPDWDEAVCLDRTKSHRLDFNANQRNADGRESCYIGDVAWRVVDDSRNMVIGSSSRHEDNFIWRFNIEPGGAADAVGIEADLDGIKSHPWQSGSGYRIEPLRIVTMSAADIQRDCLCIFKGNGVYEGAKCPKVVN